MRQIFLPPFRKKHGLKQRAVLAASAELTDGRRRGQGTCRSNPSGGGSDPIQVTYTLRRRLPRPPRVAPVGDPGGSLAAVLSGLLRLHLSSPPSAAPPGKAWPARRLRGVSPPYPSRLARGSQIRRGAGLAWGRAARRAGFLATSCAARRPTRGVVTAA